MYCGIPKEYVEVAAVLKLVEPADRRPGRVLPDEQNKRPVCAGGAAGGMVTREPEVSEVLRTGASRSGREQWSIGLSSTREGV